MKRMSQKAGQPGFVVNAYEQLTRFVEAFAAGHLNLLIVLGEPGLAKSQTVRSVMSDACWIEGNATERGTIETLFGNKQAAESKAGNTIEGRRLPPRYWAAFSLSGEWR